MQGKREFLITGNLEDWGRLPEIRTATLVPNAQSLICPNGAHIAMWDDQAVSFEGLLKFPTNGPRGGAPASFRHTPQRTWQVTGVDSGLALAPGA
jgi:hypothetical protein